MSTASVRNIQARAGKRWPCWKPAAALLLLGCALPAVCMAQSRKAGPAFAAGSDAAPPSVLRLGLTAGTHLVYEPRPAFVPPNELQARPPQQQALALEFKSPKKDQGPRSLLRVQLSGDSVLHFRPRGGGMTVTYRSQF